MEEDHDLERKVTAINRFHTAAQPTNVEAHGFRPYVGNEEKERVRETIQDLMVLHRSVMRGTGFWDWMVARRTGYLSSDLRHLPVVDYLKSVDMAYVDALLSECLPEDRPRYLAYLRYRILGLGLVTAVCYDESIQ